MPWRKLRLVRAVTAAGLVSCSMLGVSAAEPREPVPGAGADADAATVGVLDAQKSGDLSVDVRGHGPDRVQVKLRNTTGRRLRVVLPPGLVAATATGQGPGGGGGAGGLQNMGLGGVLNGAGGFGQFQGGGNGAAQGGLRSIPPAAPATTGPEVVVPAGQQVDFDVPAVCLNFGKATPTPRDHFRLVDVDDYSSDARVRRALRSLAGMGTSHGTAQAAMWRICNDVPFETMLVKGEKLINPAEVALAARFVDAVDRSAGATVDPAYLNEARLFVAVRGDGLLAKDAARLAREVDGLRILGLNARVVDGSEAPRPAGPALWLDLALTAGVSGETRAQVAVRSHSDLAGASWEDLGRVELRDAASASAVDGGSLARLLDRSVAGAFVSARPASRSVGSTAVRIENRLPFTLGGVTVKAGRSAGAPLVSLPGLGIGPGRSGVAAVQASGVSVEQVELNGL